MSCFFFSRPFTNHYYFHPLYRKVDVSLAFTAESSPLQITSNWTGTGNTWFPGAKSLITELRPINPFYKQQFLISDEHSKKNKLTLSDTRRGLFDPLPYQLYRNKKKNFFNRFSQVALFYSHKIYFYTFWPNLDNFFAEGHEI